MPTVMTPEALLELAVSHEGGFVTPKLNDSLYLHFKGWSKIENLEPYSELKALWLESNGLQKLENLDALTKLRCLYVQQNLVTKIENIQSLVSLRILDISQNRLTKLENLGSLPCLETLNVSKNLLENNESIKELELCTRLFTIDLSNNVLEGEEVLDAIAAAPSLVSFNLTGNPVMKVPQLRKKMICKMPKLTYLDRPVFAAERFAAEAWGKGGRDAEVNARAEYQKLQKEKALQETRDFKEWKERKIKERTEKQQQEKNGESQFVTIETGGKAEEVKDNAGGEEEVKQDSEGVNVTKLAHQFWSAQATEDCYLENKEKELSLSSNVEVASFRAPSYVPHVLDESLDKIVGVNAKTSFYELPSPVLQNSESTQQGEGLKEHVLPPLPPSMSPMTQGTDFDELD
jgi:dynein assembly factor 1